MIIKSSTALCNDYSMISDLAHEKAEQREETLKLRAKLEAVETARLSRAPAYTLEESRNDWRQSISVTDLALSGSLKAIAQLYINLMGPNSARNDIKNEQTGMLRLACSFAMYYCCAFRCFTAASTSSSLLLRGAGQLLYIFQYLPGLKLRQLLYQLLLCLL